MFLPTHTALSIHKHVLPHGSDPLFTHCPFAAYAHILLFLFAFIDLDTHFILLLSVFVITLSSASRSDRILASRGISVAPPKKPSLHSLPFAAPRTMTNRERLEEEEEDWEDREDPEDGEDEEGMKEVEEDDKENSDYNDEGSR